MPNKPKVFLDANILISAGKPPGGPEITRVRNLVEASLISVVTTDHIRHLHGTGTARSSVAKLDRFKRSVEDEAVRRGE